MKFYKQKSHNHLLLISVSEFVGFISNFIIIYLLTQIFPLNDFAYYSLVFNLISFLAIFANFGLGTTLIQYISKNINRNQNIIKTFISEGFKLIIIFTSFVTFLLFFLSNFLENLYEMPGLGIMLKFATIYLFTSNIIFYFERVFQGLLNFRYYTISKISLNTARLFIVISIIFWQFSILQVIFLFSLSSTIQFIIVVLYIQGKYKLLSKNFIFNWKKGKKILKFTIYIFFPDLFLFIITNFNQFILAYYVDSLKLANFLLTLTIIQALSLPITIFLKITLPYVSYYIRNNESNPQKAHLIFNLIFKYGLLITIPLSFYCFFFSDNLIFLIFGYNYNLASSYLKVFIFYLNIKMIDAAAGHFLWASDEQKLVFKLYAINSILTILLSILLIPLYSVYGAIISIIIPHSIYILYSIFLVKKKNKIYLELNVKLSIFKYILSSFLSLLFLVFINLFFKFDLNYTLNLFLLTISFFGLFFIFSLLFKAISIKEIKNFRTNFNL